MTTKYRTLIFTATLTVSLLMVFVLAGSASASSSTGDTACVTGYVINHSEFVVDGTRFTPPLPRGSRRR